MLYNLFENRDFVSVFAVALLAEGVDRNKCELVKLFLDVLVALLAEGVDRNYVSEITPEEITTSPSSRRAWIEMSRVI